MEEEPVYEEQNRPLTACQFSISNLLIIHNYMLV